MYGYMYKFTLLYTWNKHKIINQLYSNKDLNEKFKSYIKKKKNLETRIMDSRQGNTTSPIQGDTILFRS